MLQFTLLHLVGVVEMMNLVGEAFGRLVVVSEAKRGNGNKRRMNCACDCGNSVNVDMSHLRGGRIISCGCFHIERIKTCNTTHGKCGTRIYSIYNSMVTRCTNKKRNSYVNYGGRGIDVCEEWGSFERFYQWSLNNGYTSHLTIDRIDNDKGYHPENCRWVSTTIQARNKRKIKFSSSIYIGVSKAGKKWSSRIGVDNKIINLGVFEKEVEAASVRDNYIIENNLTGFTMNKCNKYVQRER